MKKWIRPVLQQMLHYCKLAEEFLEQTSLHEFHSDEEKQMAVCMAILQVGEQVRNLPESYKDKHRDVPWDRYRGIRNAMAHQYSAVDLSLMWQLVKRDLPRLRQSLQKQLTQLTVAQYDAVYS